MPGRTATHGRREGAGLLLWAVYESTHKQGQSVGRRARSGQSSRRLTRCAQMDGERLLVGQSGCGRPLEDDVGWTAKEKISACCGRQPLPQPLAASCLRGPHSLCGAGWLVQSFGRANLAFGSCTSFMSLTCTRAMDGVINILLRACHPARLRHMHICLPAYLTVVTARCCMPQKLGYSHTPTVLLPSTQPASLSFHPLKSA